MKKKKIRLRRTRNGEFRFNLIGTNGEPVATSETYKTKQMAVKTINTYFAGWPVQDETVKPVPKLNMILPPKTK